MYPYLFKSTTIRSAYISQGLIHSDADMKPIHGNRPGLENHPSKLSWEELKKKKKKKIKTYNSVLKLIVVFQSQSIVILKVKKKRRGVFIQLAQGTHSAMVPVFQRACCQWSRGDYTAMPTSSGQLLKNNQYIFSRY